MLASAQGWVLAGGIIIRGCSPYPATAADNGVVWERALGVESQQAVTAPAAASVAAGLAALQKRYTGKPSLTRGNSRFVAL